MPRRRIDFLGNAGDAIAALTANIVEDIRAQRAAEEAAVEPVPSRRRRRLAVPRRARTRKAAYGDPIYTWAFRSSQPRGGTIINYETRLEEDGVIRCNCPGWVFSKGEPASKTCKHKTQIAGEAPNILRMFKNGEDLPMFEDPLTMTQGTVTGRMSANSVNISNRPKSLSEVDAKTTTHSNLRRGRVIEI